MCPRRWTLFVAVVLLLGLVPLQGRASEEHFNRTWERTDRPVAEGQADRTWMWGPEPFTGMLTEEYAESPGGERTVQYFDKSRMEVTDPDAVDDGVWYVTNGLLATELITGSLQLGNDTFEERFPADIPVAGDPDSVNTPTYATLEPFLTGPKHAESGTIIQVMDAAGNVTTDPGLVRYGIIAQPTNSPTNHTIASIFWEFLVSEGIVYQQGEYANEQLFLDPWYPTGYPITEAFWTETTVGGTDKQLLLQCFERRCLTYTPDNPDGWRVEAGNVGLHYHTWRYQQPEPEPTPDPFPGVVYVSTITGVERSAGNVEDGVRYGATFVGTAAGDVPGAFRAEINYTPPNPGAGVTNTIVGGTWSITGETGGVSGTFQSGTAVWDDEGDYATISAIMKVTGRSGDWTDLPREARFNGTLSHTVFPPRIVGTLTLYR